MNRIVNSIRNAFTGTPAPTAKPGSKPPLESSSLSSTNNQKRESVERAATSAIEGKVVSAPIQESDQAIKKPKNITQVIFDKEQPEISEYKYTKVQSHDKPGFFGRLFNRKISTAIEVTEKNTLSGRVQLGKPGKAEEKVHSVIIGKFFSVSANTFKQIYHAAGALFDKIFRSKPQEQKPEEWLSNDIRDWLDEDEKQLQQGKSSGGSVPINKASANAVVDKKQPLEGPGKVIREKQEVQDMRAKVLEMCRRLKPVILDGDGKVTMGSKEQRSAYGIYHDTFQKIDHLSKIPEDRWDSNECATTMKEAVSACKDAEKILTEEPIQVEQVQVEQTVGKPKEEPAKSIKETKQVMKQYKERSEGIASKLLSMREKFQKLVDKGEDRQMDRMSLQLCNHSGADMKALYYLPEERWTPDNLRKAKELIDKAEAVCKQIEQRLNQLDLPTQ
jgi:hypothetical protein